MRRSQEISRENGRARAGKRRTNYGRNQEALPFQIDEHYGRLENKKCLLKMVKNQDSKTGGIED